MVLRAATATSRWPNASMHCRCCRRSSKVPRPASVATTATRSPTSCRPLADLIDFLSEAEPGCHRAQRGEPRSSGVDLPAEAELPAAATVGFSISKPWPRSLSCSCAACHSSSWRSRSLALSEWSGRKSSCSSSARARRSPSGRSSRGRVRARRLALALPRFAYLTGLASVGVLGFAAGLTVEVAVRGVRACLSRRRSNDVSCGWSLSCSLVRSAPASRSRSSCLTCCCIQSLCSWSCCSPRLSRSSAQRTSRSTWF